MEPLEPLQHFLPQVWFFILGLFLFLYVLLDGFDLGVGILSLTASSEERRSILMTSLGNVWDANETWLVLMGGSLFGAFPLAYATILNALYLPAVIMVVGLILRAVSFEFRENANRKLVWNIAFGVGSFLAALGQGFALGSVFEGITVDAQGHFAGTMWDWLTWRSVIVALTLIQGYVLIGSTYLILKTEGELQKTYFKTAAIATWTTLAGAVFITISTPAFSEEARAQLFTAPLVYIFAAIPLVGLLFIGLLLRSLYLREENTPIIWTFLVFSLSFIGLGFIIFPNIIPPSVTIYEAAAAPSSLVFMLTFIGFLIPILLFYNIYNYLVFRGKIVTD
ncbi:cytochrome oxidase d subunit II [Synechocystis sp. PCC 6803]|uniref:Cytochrome oxidase d subunit II n=1 Tax=Synechocystis sp. (strain ATCC 27184 / PCC 6803 / Kazusa) TaxID=1111708 RepID=P73160_SYNY3|nr:MULTISPECIES: cytochrome d ubiquinol oxidase subunit II [unclassified Synechocystis]BAM50905.1 cytochrome oxidase d subunit II [Synechocystis sp. PCC 6803] [Bacillus subtilis BEST7613]AGF50876.1 cytochrome oxidase d subunit II [Synechocystis sp. PCC 6803]ALJ66924.1 cytochrome oxidase [Synechocystis sp. PCC 6803]AVP88767.1 cytochrome d ubiquinol oxidase subunit II [Synechocystis sp. IPPAS B-1465]MBD2617278.1 cytochrome d ubiquinol oxidase subunit II [Synechocystis sp. FACHB-898]